MRYYTFAAALLLSGLCGASPIADVEELDGELEERAFSGPSDPKRFKFYDTINKLGTICDSDAGPDGTTLWYQDLTAAVMGVFDYKTEKVKEYTIPYATKGTHSTAPFIGNITGLQCVVRLGKDGMIYGGTGTRNELVQVNPRTSPPRFKIFSPKNQNPTGNLQNFNDFWPANNGLYFSQTTGNVVTLFDYKTQFFTNYRCHTPQSGPLGMRTDKHNNLWFTNFQGQFISKLDTISGVITEYKNCCAIGSFPEVLRASTMNQKYLWSNNFGTNGYTRIEPDHPGGVQFKTFTNPNGLGSFPFENVNDYCGRIWYSSPTMNKLYYYTPKSDHWTTVTVPGLPIGGDFEVTMHRGPGHYMFFTEGTTGKIARYTLDKSCQGMAQ